MDDKIKSYIDLTLQFVRTAHKDPNLDVQTLGLDALKRPYLKARYTEQGYDAIAHVSYQEPNDYYESWYALRGTPEQVALFYHQNNIYVDFDVSDDVSRDVREIIVLTKNGYSAALDKAIEDPKIKALAAEKGHDAEIEGLPKLELKMCLGIKEMQDDGVTMEMFQAVQTARATASAAQPAPPQ